MNAEVLTSTDDLGRAHAELRRDLNTLERAADQMSGPVSTELTRCLEGTLAHVRDHFRLEEQGGYMAEVLQREPRLERQAKELLEEHGQLLEAFTQLVEDARQNKASAPPLRTRIRNAIDELRGHESRENNLVEDAFDLDLGAED